MLPSRAADDREMTPKAKSLHHKQRSKGFAGLFNGVFEELRGFFITVVYDFHITFLSRFETHSLGSPQLCRVL